MSTPPGGHPDWQDFAITQGGNLFGAASQNLPAGITDTPVFATGNFGSIQVLCVASTGFGQLSMISSADKAGVQQFAIDTLLLRDAGVVQPRFPVRGPFVKLRINNTAGVAGTFLTWAQLQSTATPTLTFPVTSAITDDVNHSLAASASIRYDLVVMKPGLANLMLNPRDGTAHLALDVIATDETGTQTFFIGRYAAQATPINTQIVLPARPVSVIVTNTDGAAAHAFDFALVCPPSIG